MKKILFVLMTIVTICFASCAGCDSPSIQGTEDSTITICPIDTNSYKDTIVVPMKDTLHCVAITKSGTQCKNHRIAGDSLCATHRKLNK